MFLIGWNENLQPHEPLWNSLDMHDLSDLVTFPVASPQGSHLFVALNDVTTNLVQYMCWSCKFTMNCNTFCDTLKFSLVS